MAGAVCTSRHQAQPVIGVSPAVGWTIGGHQQDDHDVPPLHHWRPTVALVAAVGGILLQHGLSLLAADNAVQCGLWMGPAGTSPVHHRCTPTGYPLAAARPG
jgi:hypothetical protein